ncbi:MAG: NUDIX hydrolase [Bacteroidota bacterium]
MYKIYINETPLFLINQSELEKSPTSSDKVLIARYGGRPKLFLPYMDQLEKSNRFEAVYIYHDDLEQLFADFQSRYKLIEAAGGLVLRQETDREKALLIFRRGHWDLPKGKIEKGEQPPEAAVREVQEETGLSEVDLGDFIMHTYHTYRNRKGHRVLKRTYWYYMTTNSTEVKAQVEEDIEQVIWTDLNQFFEQPKTIYNNIKDILTQYMGDRNS